MRAIRPGTGFHTVVTEPIGSATRGAGAIIMEADRVSPKAASRRGRRSGTGLANRAAQARSRILHTEGVQDRVQLAACGRKASSIGPVGPGERSAHPPCEHLDCASRREGVAGKDGTSYLCGRVGY